MTSSERALRSFASARAAWLWQALARAAGRAVTLRAQPIAPSDPGRRVLLLAPHPDDEASSAATLLQHLALGAEVTIAIVTDGSRSRRRGLGPEDMRALRRSEAEAAREVIGPTHWHWLGLRDLELDALEAARAIEPLLKDRSPDLIYAPSFVDGHPDHLATAAGLASLAGERRETRIRLYPVTTPLTPVLSNVAIDGSDVRDRAIRAFEAHASQRPTWTPMLRMKAYAAALYGGGSWVDEFWELPAPIYARLHAAHRSSPWQGLRERSFRDPIPYLRGLAPRLELLRLSRSV